MMNNKKTQSFINKYTPYILIFCSIIGLLASLILTYDKINVLRNPNYDPACNINPILSCGSVMKTEQASLLGMPNTIFGIIAFTALLTFGAVLAAGAIVKKWIWLTAQVAATLGVAFMHYLFFQGVFRINAICPWCFVTWMATIPIFIYITLYNLREGFFGPKFKKLSIWANNNHANILVSWYMIILLILLQQFWYYWKTLI